MKSFPPALVAVLALAAAVPAFAETDRVTRRIALEPGGTLHINSFSGRVTITGADQSEVTVDAVRRGSRQALDNLKLEISGGGSSVKIEENRRDRPWSWFGRHQVVETDFDIKVPRRANLDVSVFSASLDVSGVDGAHHLKTFSSRTTLDGVNGSIRAKSFSGPIEIRQTAWRGAPSLEVETFSGHIRLRLPESARGDLDFNSFSGRLTADVPMTFKSGSRRQVHAQIGGQGGDGGHISLKSFSGSASLER